MPENNNCENNEAIKSFESFIDEAEKFKDLIAKNGYDFFFKEDENSYIDIYIFLKIKKNEVLNKNENGKKKLNDFQLFAQNLPKSKFGLLHGFATGAANNYDCLLKDNFQDCYRDYIESKIEKKIEEILRVFGKTIENKVIDNIKERITKEFNYNDDDVLFTKNQIQEYLDETIKKLLIKLEIKINTDANPNPNPNKHNSNNYYNNNNQSGNNTNYTNSNTSNADRDNSNNYNNNRSNTNYTKSKTPQKFAILIGLIIIVSLVIYFKKRGITHSNKKIIKPVSNKSINIANNNNLKPINRINHGSIYQPNIVRKSQNIVKENKMTESDVVSTKSSVPYKKTVRLSNSQKPLPKVAYVPNISNKIFQEQGFQLFKMSGCLYCHRIYNKGYKNGSNLSNIGSSMSLAEIENQIIRPANSSMPPNANMPSNEVAQIANWLESLK